ncbi:MAG TPA: bifunctional 4-hydroxy-2-oxoglutarate aldolase/2-dehydro-3-deoxy-phosphogluconate aldolase [Aggregatilineales bacterium]|nr:bifunctional 4-hydroxy-2-oxoglutarate aldolase/2-dehydro-3-deoxy-phosphogluconate aldolase [Aggregatilineales bacterium]
MLPQHVLDRLLTEAVMVGMRGNFPPPVALRTAEIMREHNMTIFELTLNSVQPLEAMTALKKQWGDGVIAGMGTVLTVDDAERAIGAGADFIVSPAFVPSVVEYAQKMGVFVAPGVITPTEAVTAWAMGVTLLKLFPIGALGLDYFKAIFAPLNHIRFMCNGAVDGDNIPQFMKAGAVAAGMGGWLTGDGQMPEALMRSRAQALREGIAGVRTV